MEYRNRNNTIINAFGARFVLVGVPFVGARTKQTGMKNTGSVAPRKQFVEMSAAKTRDQAALDWFDPDEEEEKEDGL